MANTRSQQYLPVQLSAVARKKRCNAFFVKNGCQTCDICSFTVEGLKCKLESSSELNDAVADWRHVKP